MKKVEIKNRNEAWLGTKCIVDGRSIPNVRSVDFHFGVEEVPEFTFNTNGIPDIDVMGCVVINPSTNNLQEACQIITHELQKHGEFYDAFVASVSSSIHEVPEEMWSGELAEKIVKRISGEE